ncbi:MAG: DUF2282 domain-containing protein [Gammaproteobacteria bacterium]|nr:DUF2282 domain-containing protein [Gammaproteobacteria bacterium]
MNLKKLAIATAVGSFLAAGSMSATAGDAPSKDKCYGVAKAGKNDCAGNGHSCAGQAKKDNDPNEWVHMPKADCEKMGGKTEAPKK